MIQLTNISKHFGTKELFSNLNFRLNSGDRVGLVGRNGTGKSTLFKLILGEEQPDEGEISIPKGYKIGALKQHLEFISSDELKGRNFKTDVNGLEITASYLAEQAAKTGLLEITPGYFQDVPLQIQKSGKTSVQLVCNKKKKNKDDSSDKQGVTFLTFLNWGENAKTARKQITK